MTSQINYLGINENFPVAGVDNDTQVFRDNFDTIKTSLRYAKDEITALQDNTAKINEENDFGLNILTNALIQNFRERTVPLNNITTTPTTIDYQQGYHFYGIVNDDGIVFQFQNFPGDPNIVPASQSQIGIGRVRLELYSDIVSTISAGSFINSKRYTIASLGTTDWNSPLISNASSRSWGAGSPVVGGTFTAQGVGSGDGTAYPTRIVTFTVGSSGASSIKKNSGFPTYSSVGTGTVSVELTVTNKENPMVFEVWRHSPTNIFINYLGIFS